MHVLLRKQLCSTTDLSNNVQSATSTSDSISKPLFKLDNLNLSNTILKFLGVLAVKSTNMIILSIIYFLLSTFIVKSFSSCKYSYFKLQTILYSRISEHLCFVRRGGFVRKLESHCCHWTQIEYRQ